MSDENPFGVLSELNFPDSEISDEKKSFVSDSDTDKDRANQKIRVWLQKKKRNGKPVSVITGFNEYREDMKELAKMIKVKLGVGGSNTDDEIVIQGRDRDKIIEILRSQGFKDVKKAGG